MCLAVPMRVMEVTGLRARCEARGETREVSLMLLEPGSVSPGDHLVAHLGQALHKVSAEEAEASWALLDQLLAAAPATPPTLRPRRPA